MREDAAPAYSRGVPAKTKTKTKPKPKTKMKPKTEPKTKPKLLSGGNPQIAKGDGNAPVRAYIAALAGWKQKLCKRLDALIVKAVPGAKRAVRWNSPMYSVGDNGYFVSFHVLTKYVKVTWFYGKQLDPLPPGGTPKSGEGRWLDLHEDDALDVAQLTRWMQQAAAIPGWKP